MKKKFYDVGTYLYMANQKRGTELVIAAAIAGAASLAGAGINAASQSAANSTNMQLTKDTLEEQKALFHEANQFNHNEAAISRQFSANESAIARQYNSQEAETNRQFQAGMIQKYMDYNSASAQYQRYLQAGLNPASLAGNVNNQGFSIPSGSAATTSPVSVSPASAAGVPSLPTAHVNPVDYGSIVSNGIKSASDIFSLGKTYQETKGLVTENKFKEMTIQKGLELSDSEIRKNYATANQMDKDANLAEQRIKESAAIIKNLNAQAENTDVDTQIKNIQKLYADDFFKYQSKEMQEKYKFTKGQADTIVKYTYAQIAAAQGSAAQAYAMAEYYKELKQLPAAERAQIEATTDYIGTQDARERYGLFLDRTFGYKERFWGIEHSKQGVDRQEYENSTPYRIIQGIKDVAVGVGAGVGTAYGVSKGLKGVKQKNYIQGNPRFYNTQTYYGW